VAAQETFKKFKGEQTTVVVEDTANGSFLLTTGRTGVVSTAIKCLPNTVDPRGPKGK
jgi:hypothetical protein